MSEQERQTIINALKAIASALLFCETSVGPVVHDRIDAIYAAIAELRGDAE